MVRFFKSKLFWVLAVALIVTFGYALIHDIHPVVDAQAYDVIATNILSGNGFREQPELSITSDTSILRAGPGYEYFLAGIYGVFGHHLWIVWLIQALLHIATAYIIYILCVRIFSDGGQVIGFIAATVFAYHPDLIEIAAMLMTETLYLFLTVILLWLFVRTYDRTESVLLASVSGIVIALAVLNRPMVALYGLLFIVLYALRKRYRELILFCFFSALCMAPWIVRNYQIYNQFIPTTLIGEYNIWIGNRVGSNGGQIAEGYNPATSHGEQFGYLRFKNEAMGAAKTFILKHPGEFIAITAKRFVRFFSLIRPMGFWFYQTGLSQGIFVLCSLVAISLIYITGIAGYILALKKKLAGFWFYLTFALLVPAPLILSVVQSRYRFQIYPLLCIFGAYFIYSWYTKDPERKKPLVYTVVFLGLVTAIDAYAYFDVVLKHIYALL